jgi:hypothetical protein
MEQKAVEIAVDRSEENVVEGGEGHCWVGSLLESTLLFWVWLGQC